MSGYPLPRDVWLFLGRLCSREGWSPSHDVAAPQPFPAADVLLGWAQSQGVGPLVEAQLLSHANEFRPGPDAGEYKRSKRNQEVASLIGFEIHAKQALAALEDRLDYPPLVLKGGALRYQVYSTPWHRPCRDLDVLLKPQDLSHGAEVLRGLGYHLQEEPGQPTPLATALNLDMGTMRVELHSSLFSRYKASAGYESMAAFSQPLPLLSPALSPDLTGHILVGVLHLVRHGFQYRLKDLADLDRLAGCDGIDWHRLQSDLAKLHMLPALEWTLALLSEITGSVIPAHAWPASRGLLGPRVLGSLLATPRHPQFWHLGQHLPLPVGQALALASCSDSARPLAEAIWDVGRRRTRWIGQKILGDR